MKCSTYQLPEAQMDRFLFKIEMNYPAQSEEEQILRNYHSNKNNLDLSTVESVMTPENLEKYRALVGQIHVEEKLLTYISKLIVETRSNKDLYLGASPRASLAVLTGAKALAAMAGRDFITPEDVKYILPHAIRHRIILTPEREMEGAGPDDLISEIAKKVEVPR